MMDRIKCSETAMMTKPKEHGAMAKPMVAAARISGMSTSPFQLSASCRFDVHVCISLLLKYHACAGSVLVKTFANHLFAFLPQCSCALRIEGVSPHTCAQAGS